MGPSRRVRIGLLLLTAITVLGTAWYALVERFSLLDAAYQTVMTITTVGFAEIRDFDAGARAFTLVLMVVGVGAALFTLTAMFEDFVENQFLHFGRRRMDRRIERLEGHAIVCGYGRVGSRIAARLADEVAGLVVIDQSADRCAVAAADGHPTIQGDSTDDDLLREAGIERAATLVVSLASDADAISTVLSARVLNPALRIVSRANSENSEAKLLRAGVDRVVNPLSSGAERLAAFAQKPAVADFLDVIVHDGSLEYRLEEVRVPPGSPIEGTSLADAHIRAETGALVLALREADGTFRNNPAPDTPLAGGVTLIAIGTGEQLQALESHVGRRRASGRPVDGSVREG